MCIERVQVGTTQIICVVRVASCRITRIDLDDLVVPLGNPDPTTGERRRREALPVGRSSQDLDVTDLGTDRFGTIGRAIRARFVDDEHIGIGEFVSSAPKQRIDLRRDVVGWHDDEQTHSLVSLPSHTIGSHG
jgi:hypothetical protein